LQNSSLKGSCTKPGTFFSAKTAQKGSGFLILRRFFVQAAIVFSFSGLIFFEKAREGWLFPPENAILFCRMVVLSCAAYAGFMMISEG